MIGKTAFRGTFSGVGKGKPGLPEKTLAPEPGPVRAGTPPGSVALTVKFNLRPVMPKISSDARLSINAQSLLIVGSAWAGTGTISTNELRATQTAIIRYIDNASFLIIASSLDETYVTMQYSSSVNL
jgi:hypothetical protein